MLGSSSPALNDTESILPLNARSLQFRWRRATHDVSFDDRFLSYTYSGFGNRTTMRTALHRLMDDFVVDTPSDSRAYAYFRRFRYALACAAIIYFSEIPRYVPYLAPALLAYAFLMSYRGTLYSSRCKQTRVLTNYSEQVVAIPHLPKLKGARKRFEERLREAIKEAKTPELE